METTIANIRRELTINVKLSAHLICCLIFTSKLFAISGISFETVHKPQQGIKSWLEFRNQSVVHQKLDYACGAASLATLLTYYYRDAVTEETLINIMKSKKESSLYDLSKAAESLGYISMGLASNFETLRTMTLPVIVFLKTRKSEHFSVLKHLINNKVYLADPSYGNITLTHHQFKRRWLKNNEGKFLLVLKKTAKSA